MADWRFWRSSEKESAPADSDIADPPAEPLWTDDAIESDEEDGLDRKPFADMVAERIDACVPGQKSTVFGLVGPWGSGKTSLINFVRGRLGNDWKIAIFSPWASDTVAGLQSEFLAAVDSLLEGDDERSRNARKAFRKYAGVCAQLLKAVPQAGAGLGGAAEKALEITNPPWHKQFKEVSNVLETLGSRVLIIADDIDRLDAEELLSLLKVVRLLGRFPNVHYLIAYDQSTVESLLKSKGLATRSTAFMEKIVQYPFEVPPIAGIIQRRLLSRTIVELIERLHIRLDQVHAERLSEYIAVLGPALVTPRAQIRFKEQLLAFGGMLNFREVDVVDFVALSFLRVFYHHIYDRIPTWKNALQSGKDITDYFKETEITDEQWIERIRPLVNGDDDAALVKHILGGLFKGIRSTMLYPKEHKLALADDTYFQRYFLFGIAEDDVEDQLIESALNDIMFGGGESVDAAHYRDILDGPDNQRAALAYEKSERRRSDDPLGADLNLVRFLFERLNARPEVAPSFDSAQRVLWRWVEEEAFKALQSKMIDVIDLRAELSQADVLGLAFRILRDARIPNEAKVDALGDLNVYYRDRLMNDLAAVLDSGLDFNSIVFVIAVLSSDNNFHEFGETLLSVGDIDLLSRVTTAMVVENQWRGSDGLSPELAFNGETLIRLFTNDAIVQLAGRLPVAPPVGSISNADTSPENKAYFAHASVKSMAATLT
ncbi:KAP family P-loop NTPase fold protein [Mycolicibacterium peregrinum]|uniref:KAP family P-loop NTPase fold protein n=1 Tax=Mycolicibacterium peregrinum TaxID=43304 RepID=UPI003AAEBBA5